MISFPDYSQLLRFCSAHSAFCTTLDTHCLYEFVRVARDCWLDRVQDPSLSHPFFIVIASFTSKDHLIQWFKGFDMIPFFLHWCFYIRHTSHVHSDFFDALFQHLNLPMCKQKKLEYRYAITCPPALTIVTLHHFFAFLQADILWTRKDKAPPFTHLTHTASTPERFRELLISLQLLEFLIPWIFCSQTLKHEQWWRKRLRNRFFATYRFHAKRLSTHPELSIVFDDQFEKK